MSQCEENGERGQSRTRKVQDRCGGKKGLTQGAWAKGSKTRVSNTLESDIKASKGKADFIHFFQATVFNHHAIHRTLANR